MSCFVFYGPIKERKKTKKFFRKTEHMHHKHITKAKPSTENMKTRKFFGIFHTYLIQFKHNIATRMYKRKINEIATPKITLNMNKESTQMRDGGQAVAPEKERAIENC